MTRIVFYARSDLMPNPVATDDLFRRLACVRSLLVEIDVHILEQETVRGGDKVLNAGDKAVSGARIDQI